MYVHTDKTPDTQKSILELMWLYQDSFRVLFTNMQETFFLTFGLGTLHKHFI